jgi:hypothetical protein
VIQHPKLSKASKALLLGNDIKGLKVPNILEGKRNSTGVHPGINLITESFDS